MKKVSYIDLLKEAIAEYDAKSLDYRGPMIDSILTFDGSTELKTNEPSDIASVLERYYFREESEEGVPVPEEEKNEIKTGEEPEDVEATKKDIEKELTEDELPGAEKQISGGTGAQAGVEVGKDEEEAKPADVAGAVAEEAVLERLIAEMEEEEEKEKEKEEEKEKEKEEEEEEGEEKEEKKKKTSESKLGPLKTPRDEELEEAFEIFKEQIEVEEPEKEEEEEEELDVDKEVEAPEEEEEEPEEEKEEEEE